MVRLPFRLLLFLSSYSPLFALLSWRSRDDQVIWIALATVAVLSVATLLIVVFAGRDIEGARLEVKDVEPRDAETLAYVATYLIPFLSLDLTQSEDLISFIVFMSVLGIIAVTSHTLFVNPVLSMLGFRTFRVTDRDDQPYFLVIRGRITSHEIVRPFAVDDFVRFEPWRRHAKQSSMP